MKKQRRNYFAEIRENKSKKVIELAKNGYLIPEIIEELEVSREFIIETFATYRKKNNKIEKHGK